MSKNNFSYFTTNDLLDIKAVFEELLENKDCFYTGLCNWIDNVNYQSIHKYCTRYNLTISYVSQNRPRASIWQNLKKYLFGAPLSAYYWKVGNIETRIKFIKKHIKLIENEIVKRTLIAINSDETVIM